MRAGRESTRTAGGSTTAEGGCDPRVWALRAENVSSGEHFSKLTDYCIVSPSNTAICTNVALAIFPPLAILSGIVNATVVSLADGCQEFCAALPES
jgi:hypothetical protein